MKKTLLFLSIFCLFILTSNAQDAMRSFKGRVVDSSNFKPLGDATISIYRASDTSLLNFGFTTPIGNFTLTTKSRDSLLIIISIVGYDEKVYREPAQEGWRFSNYGDVKLNPQPFSFKGITVRTSAISIKGDTIEINASRFKVLPGSDVAQLFKKIPGFEVNVKGEIKVNGSEVTKIMVDGSDFFGNNPGMVSKNLSADMIETVQVFEDKNEDGSPKESAPKIINLKLKKGKKNGMFGDAMAGYGTEDRYETGLRINNFKNDRKLSFVVNSNNTNETGFDFGFSNWHNADNYSRNGGAGDDEFIYYYNGNSGEGNINNKTSSGFTYFNEFSKKRKLSFNILGSRNIYNSISSSSSFYALNDSTTRNSIDSNYSEGRSMNMSAEINYTKTFDSTGYFEIGYYGTMYENEMNSNKFNSIFINNTSINNGIAQIRNEMGTMSNRVNANYRRMLRKDRRYSFSTFASYKINGNNSDNFQFQQNSNDTFNTLNTSSYNTDEFLVKLFGRMPLYKKSIILNVSIDRWLQTNASDRLTSTAQNQYDRIFEQNYANKIDSLSIEFDNRMEQYTVKPYVSFERKYLYASGGLTFLTLNLKNNNITDNSGFNKQYSKFLPFVNLSYYPEGKGYMYVSASKTTDFPNISELQPVLNLSNNFERQNGNENLAPQDNYSFRVYANYYKMKGFRYMYLSLRGNVSENAKIYSNRQTESGIIIKTPINIGGKRDFNAWASASKKLWKIMHFNLSYNISIDRNPLLINDISSFGTNNSMGLSPSFSFTKSDSLEFSFGMNWNNSKFSNSLNDNLNFKQNVYQYDANIRTVLKWGTEINSSLNISDQRNVPNIGKLIPIWSAYVQQPLGKKSKFSLKLSAYDILKQNTQISRAASENFIYISRSNMLQQYFMMTLVYKIKKMGGDDDVYDYAY